MVLQEYGKLTNTCLKTPTDQKPLVANTKSLLSRIWRPRPEEVNSRSQYALSEAILNASKLDKIGYCVHKKDTQCVIRFTRIQHSHMRPHQCLQLCARYRYTRVYTVPVYACKCCSKSYPMLHPNDPTCFNMRYAASNFLSGTLKLLAKAT